MLGGISWPRIPEHATRAVAYSLLYPYFSIWGNMVIPIVATADEDDPEIAPKRADETIVTIPSPPVNLPTTALAKDTILEEIPAAVITPPAKIKKGIAIKTKELRPEKIAGTAKPIFISKKNIMARLPMPKQAKSGNPASSIIMVRPTNSSNVVIYHPP